MRFDSREGQRILYNITSELSASSAYALNYNYTKMNVVKDKYVIMYFYDCKFSILYFEDDKNCVYAFLCRNLLYIWLLDFGCRRL